jgi:multiple sugar transport system substrate-binding protein
MSKKLTTLALLLAVLLAGLPAAAQEEEVTLRLWAHQEIPFNEALQDLIDAYVELHPNVSIEMEVFEYELYIQTIQTAMPAGDEADILEMFGTWTCSYGDFLASMPEAALADFDPSIFFDAPLDGYECDGAYYGLPFEFNIEYGAVLVNQAMFEAAGLAYPPEWANWDEFLADAKALALVEDGMMSVAGYDFITADGITFAFLAGILQRGGDYWNEDGTAFTFNTEEAKATIEQMLAFVDEGVVDPVLFNDSSNWVGDAFFTDQVAIGLIGPWAVAYGLEDFPDFGNFDYVTLPPVGEEPLFAADSGWGLTVSGHSQAQEVAWDFVQFAAANADNALSWNLRSGTIPALRELVEDETYQAQLLEALPWVAADLPLLQYGSYIGDMPDRDLVFYEIVYPTILDTLQGLLPVEDALMYIDEDANATFE